MKTKHITAPAGCILSCLASAALVGCATGNSDQFRYSGNLESAEHAIALLRPQGNLSALHVQTCDDTWARYCVVRAGFKGDGVTKGTAVLLISHGKASVSGSAPVRALIKDALTSAQPQPAHRG